MLRTVRPDPVLGLRQQIEAAAQDEQDGDDDRSGQKETVLQERRDAGEQEDLSAREPGRTKALRARLEAELRAMGARFPSAAGSLP